MGLHKISFAVVFVLLMLPGCRSCRCSELGELRHMESDKGGLQNDA